MEHQMKIRVESREWKLNKRNKVESEFSANRAKPKGIHGEAATTILKTTEGESRWGVGTGICKNEKEFREER